MSLTFVCSTTLCSSQDIRALPDEGLLLGQAPQRKAAAWQGGTQVILAGQGRAGQLLALRGPAGIQPALRKDRICLRLTSRHRRRQREKRLLHLSVQRQSPVSGPISASFFFSPYFFFFLSFFSAHVRSGVYLFARAVAATHPICGAGCGAYVQRSVAGEETPVCQSVRPSVRPSRAPGALRAGSSAAAGSVHCSSAGNLPAPVRASTGSGSGRGGHPAPLRLLPSASPTIRCVYFSPRPLPANPPSAEPLAGPQVTTDTSLVLFKLSPHEEAARRSSSPPGARPAFHRRSPLKIKTATFYTPFLPSLPPRAGTAALRGWLQELAEQG